jgi:hypothetical protein
MTLGDAFNRRKKIAANLQTWLNRLREAGKDVRTYRTKAIEGPDAFQPEPGTEKVSGRHYTIEECQSQISELTRQDRELALRISLTNQRAKSRVIDLDGSEREFTIPELLVLKNEIIPKLEEIARATPAYAQGVNVFEYGNGFIKHREVVKVERKKETISEKGLKVEDRITEGFDIKEYTDYGRPIRDIWNQVDRIQDFAERVKQAIQDANKTELVEA